MPNIRKGGEKMLALTIRFPKGRLFYINGVYGEPAGRIPSACFVENGHTLIETVNGSGQVEYRYLYTGTQDADLTLQRVSPPQKVR